MSRPALVQKMLDSVKKQGDYYDDYPKHWMSEDRGMEYALIKYVESVSPQLAAAFYSTSYTRKDLKSDMKLIKAAMKTVQS